MKYYSTNHQAPDASLQEAVVKGLASDKGLYMPEVIKSLPQAFYDNIENMFSKKSPIKWRMLSLAKTCLPIH